MGDRRSATRYGAILAIRLGEPGVRAMLEDRGAAHEIESDRRRSEDEEMV